MKKKKDKKKLKGLKKIKDNVKVYSNKVKQSNPLQIALGGVILSGLVITYFALKSTRIVKDKSKVL